jgi:hypothetical protein
MSLRRPGRTCYSVTGKKLFDARTVRRHFEVLQRLDGS